ncbi:MAG: type I restriction enzyme HsdR N-terminal domain-containing protein [Desulfovibrionaceae bacterium]
MHDISLGVTLRDYLTGEEVEATTYEDLRQALARLLVEERGYPRASIVPRAPVRFPVEGREYTRLVDFAVLDEGTPLLVVLFCSGECTTYEREIVAAARLFPGGPARLAVVTDTRDAVLLAVANGERLARGMRAIPDWTALTGLAARHAPAPLDEAHLERERRILFMYSESLYDCCSRATCAIESRGGRWEKGEEGDEG